MDENEIALRLEGWFFELIGSGEALEALADHFKATSMTWATWADLIAMALDEGLAAPMKLVDEQRMAEPHEIKLRIDHGALALKGSREAFRALSDRIMVQSKGWGDLNEVYLGIHIFRST